jgi:hypothetical protein
LTSGLGLTGVSTPLGGGILKVWVKV